MMSWIQGLAGWARRSAFTTVRQGNRTSRTRTHRIPTFRRGVLFVEGLERREVLSTASISPFLAISGEIPSSGQATTVDFHLASDTLSAAKGGSTVLIGLDPRADNGPTLTPRVTTVVRSDGAAVPAVSGSTGLPFIGLATVPANGQATYTATVQGASGQSGKFILDGFLVGDVNGDLKVDESDLDLIAAAYGSHRGQPRYDAAADINQDGVVGNLDRSYAVRNLGASATPIASTTTATPTQATPTVANPVVGSQIASNTAVTPETTSPTPVTITATVPSVAATATPANQSVGIAWIPVIVPIGQSPSQIASLGGLTWSPQLSAYYPTNSSTVTFASSSGPVYYTTPVSMIPGGPSYVAQPTSLTPAATSSSQSTTTASVSR